MSDGEWVLGDHVLLEVVGTGTDSVIHRARHRDRPGRIVAIKRLRVRARPEAVARLRREADLLARLAHPALVPLLDVVDDPGLGLPGPQPGRGIALVLPWAPGGSLEDVLQREGALPWPRVASLGARLASGLAAAHAAGVLHRDVKPSNVLLGAEDEPRLAGFGTALLRVDAPDDVVGTPSYLDPAVAVDGHAPSTRSDEYALGVLLFRTLSGQLPVPAGSPAVTGATGVAEVHPPLGQLVPEAPRPLVSTIEHAMARDPAARFGSVQQLQDVLESLVREHEAETRDSGAGPVGPTAPVAELEPPRARRRSTAPALVAVILLPALVLAWLVLLRDRGPEVASVDPAPTTSTHPTSTPATSTPMAPADRTAPPRCAQSTTPEFGDQVLEADVDGRGCALPLVVAEEAVDGHPTLVLTVPEEAGELAGRYAVAAPGDRVVVGDWDCDGSATPAVVRPDGTTFLFDGYGALDPETGPPLEAGAHPRVVTDPDGCDRLTD